MATEQVVKICSELELGVDPLVVEELLQAWILNCFEHTSEPLGYSAYYVSSFCSHSCYPNASWALGDDDDTHVLTARRDIELGDEVTISYLEEHTLLECAEVRKKHLYDTKLFECTCERCEPAGSNEDPCRGFRCQACGICGVFHRLKEKKGQGLKGVNCLSCGKSVTAARAQDLMVAEAALQAWLQELDDCEENGQAISDVMKASELERWLETIDDEREALLGPQHWLCDKLWRFAISFYTDEEQWDDVEKMQSSRAWYRAQAYRDNKPAKRISAKRKAK